MTKDCGKSASEETRQSILGDSLHKSGVESGKIAAHEDSRGEFSKRLSLVVDDLVKETAGPIDTNEGSSSDENNCSGPDDSDDNESEESPDDVLEISIKDYKTLKETCKSRKSAQIYVEPGDRDGVLDLNMAADANLTDVTGEDLALSVLTSFPESLNPLASKEESFNRQDSRSFELNRCSNDNKQEHVNQNMGDDLLKSCSCSFCLKAAFIWSDLHYQDMKGRLSALKKSQKEASNLVQRHDTERPIHGSSNQESDLKGQWRSLFSSMGDILAHESKDLQNSLVKMTKLREGYRTDLQRATEKPQKDT